MDNDRTGEGDSLNAQNPSDNVSRSKRSFDRDSIAHFLDEYVFGSCEGMRRFCAERHLALVVISSICRGAGQVMFLDNPWTGFLILLAILSWNPLIGLLGIIGGLSNLATATLLLGIDLLKQTVPTYMNNGIFAYNGILVGLAMGEFTSHLNGKTFACLIPCDIIISYVACSIHVGITNIFPEYPVFSFPFNLAMLLWLPATYTLPWIPTSELLEPNLVADYPVIRPNIYQDSFTGNQFANGLFRGLSQVYVCSSAGVGVVIFFALCIGKLKGGLLALFGSLVGMLFGLLVSVSTDEIAFGLTSYNAALTMMAIGCIFGTFNRKNFFMAFYHSIMCIFIELSFKVLMENVGLPYLTLPFCFSVLFFSVFAYRIKHEQELKETMEAEDSFAFIRGGPRRLDSGPAQLKKWSNVRGGPRPLDSVTKTDSTGKELKEFNVNMV